MILELANDSETKKSDLVFVQESMKAPLLEREDELRLAQAWKESKDEAALHQLICAYTRLVISMAVRFRYYGLPIGDLIQEGNLGLMQAAERFEPDRDVRFSTYAKWWIRACIQDFILRNWSIVRTGSTAAHKQLFFNLRRLRSELSDVTSEVMSIEEREKIAEHLHVTIRDVETMENRLSGHDLSLSTPMSEQSNEDWQDFLPDLRLNPEDSTVEANDSLMRHQWIEGAMCVLDSREQQIITLRRLLDSPVTLETIGKQLQITKERVRQIEARAIRKMRYYLMESVHEVRQMLDD